MDCLIMDATHGGVKLAIEFSKLNSYKNIYLHDIYNTLKEDQKEKLEIYNVKTVDLDKINSKDLLIVYPIHLPLSREDVKEKLEHTTNFTFKTHHEAVKILLEDYFKNHGEVLKVEITGVKGKTSCAFMLKEILKDLNPLVLSSLGIIQVKDDKSIILKKNISITPANIKEAVDIAYKTSNPICDIAFEKIEPTDNLNYGSFIIESSLGATGIGDVGLLTNIVENYTIAKNKRDAKTAKSQIFRCKKVAIKKETLDKYYKKESEQYKSKIITFSLTDLKSNVIAKDIDYNLDKTSFKVIYRDVKTINNKQVSGEFDCASFAPGKHHMENILGVITACIALEIPIKKIVNGLSNYKGVMGRTHIKTKNNLKIIEEINPGINTRAIELSIKMLKNPQDYSIIIGGDYGITCEEIDEKKVANLLNSNLNLNLILTGDVGKSIKEKMTSKIKFIENYQDAIDFSIANNLNILFIYRSDYRKLSQR